MFFDLTEILAMRRAIAELDPTGPPGLRIIAGEPATWPPRVALLPGSFNPPTTAHEALAATTLASGRVDRVFYVLATRTVDKERIEGMTLADRLILLGRLVETHPRLGVILLNRGLYVEQAEIAHEALPAIRDLWFVVGFDKIVQIFDPRYYVDRDVALDRLFRSSSFLVAPRGDADAADLATLLARPENCRFAARVLSLGLPAAYRDISSSRARGAPESPIVQHELPPLVSQFIEATGAYLRPSQQDTGETIDRYAWRERLIDLAERGDIESPAPSQLKDLVVRVTGLNEVGRALREQLTRDHSGVGWGTW
jgi:nicotinic acid mononucleotide adenylyltransferase